MLHIALSLRGRTIFMLTVWPDAADDDGEAAPDQRGTGYLAAGEIAPRMAEPDTFAFGLRPAPVRAAGSTP